ncbi:unnamed protein product [Trichobilharzia regenti]|nr:unnamed protein product [Trichobilharzia regenti]
MQHTHGYYSSEMVSSEKFDSDALETELRPEQAGFRKELRPEQAGFRKGKSCTDQIATLYIIILRPEQAGFRKGKSCTEQIATLREHWIQESANHVLTKLQLYASSSSNKAWNGDQTSTST